LFPSADQVTSSAPASEEKIGTSPYTNCAFDAPASTENFDAVILDGRVMDPECGFDGVRNVGIKDNRIALITAGKIKGAKTVDAAGFAVAPGFINTHNHSFAPFDQRMLAHDGVTTLLDTEGGVSNAPLFYSKYANNSFVNYGVGISHEEVRRVVLDGLSAKQTSDPTNILISRGDAQTDGRAQWALDVPTPAQHQDILKLYEQGMCDGAIAVASTVGYMGYGVPTYELFDLQKLAAKWGRFFGAHTRFGPTESLPRNYTLGVREVLSNALALDAPIILSHIQNQNWQESYELARRLQKKGKIIFAEYYPAITGSPNIATPQLLPDKIAENNMNPTKTLINPRTGEFFESNDAFFKMQEESPEEMIFVVIRDPSWMKEWPHMKDIAIASDSIAYRDKNGDLLPIDADPSEYGGHPRNAGSSGIVLREAREQSIPLMDIINNLSYIPAKYFAMVGLEALQLRGRMQPGMIADITIFNPETVAESSSMKEGERGLFTKGIEYVMVNGQLIIENGVSDTLARAGQPIRYPLTDSCEIPELVDLKDKEFQWHSDLPGYPPTRFKPNDVDLPSPFELDRGDHGAER
jgi:hypothetical protein